MAFSTRRWITRRSGRTRLSRLVACRYDMNAQASGTGPRRAEECAMKKSEVLELLQEMPEDLDVEKLIYTLYLRQKLEIAEADLAAGRVISHEEVEREMEEWRD
jgi:hypothetical protein